VELMVARAHLPALRVLFFCRGGEKPGVSEATEATDPAVSHGSDAGSDVDVDADGHGDPGTMEVAGAEPTGFVTSSGDCDDMRADVGPGEVEIL
jgi:hypothetical protein